MHTGTMGRRLAVPFALLGLVILASLGFAASRASTGQASAQPGVTPTVTPTPLPTSVPVPSPTPLTLSPTPAPTSEVTAPPPERPVPALTRAGLGCNIELRPSSANASAGQIHFAVPDNMWAASCVGLDYQDPRTSPCCESPLTVKVQARAPHTIIRELIDVESVDVESAEWHDIGDRGAWAVDLSVASGDETPHTERWMIVAVGATRSVVIRSSDQRTDIDPDNLQASYQELIDSLHVWLDEDPYPLAASTDPWCVGDRWIIDVPASWFTYGACDGSGSEVQLNTSDIADIAMQCECFGPLWISERFPMSPGDPGVTVLSDVTSQRSDGTAIRIVESIVEDDVIPRLELRSVTIEFDDRPVTIVANRTPSHAGPLHAWSDTIEAQTFLVERLQLWNDPACATSAKPLLRTTVATPLVNPPASGTAIVRVPAGAALRPTGCTQLVGDTTWAEVHVPALSGDLGGRLAGWVEADSLAERDPSDCSTDQSLVTDRTWERTVTGDFDGDGETDTMHLHGNPFDGGSSRSLPVAEAAVSFAAGTVAVGPLGSGTTVDGPTGTGLLGSDVPSIGSLWAIGSFVDVVRPVGLDRDLALVADPFQRGAYTSQMFLIGFFECSPRVVGVLSWGASVGNQLGYCLAPTPFGSIIRSFHTVSGIHQEFAGKTDAHLQWVGDGFEPLPEFGVGSEPMCGQRYEPDADPGAWTGPPGPLEGLHGLTLQWLGSDSREWGEITFETVGQDRYLVNGSQTGRALDGTENDDMLQVYGVIVQRPNGDLHFEGRITSQVSYLNDGLLCERSGGQDFQSTQGRRYWRIQDQINCDEISSDYIDIYFD